MGPGAGDDPLGERARGGGRRNGLRLKGRFVAGAIFRPRRGLFSKGGAGLAGKGPCRAPIGSALVLSRFSFGSSGP